MWHLLYICRSHTSDQSMKGKESSSQNSNSNFVGLILWIILAQPDLWPNPITITKGGIHRILVNKRHVSYTSFCYLRSLKKNRRRVHVLRVLIDSTSSKRPRYPFANKPLKNSKDLYSVQYYTKPATIQISTVALQQQQEDGVLSASSHRCGREAGQDPRNPGIDLLFENSWVILEITLMLLVTFCEDDKRSYLLCSVCSLLAGNKQVLSNQNMNFSDCLICLSE